MSSNSLINLAAMAVSISNTIILLWLGATLLLNAQRREWGVWLAGIGLLLGSAFFVSHSAILGLGIGSRAWRSMIFWWNMGLLPITILPFAWYTIMLWYAGFWASPKSSPLYRRHRVWLRVVLGIVFLGLIGLITAVLLTGSDPSKYRALRDALRWPYGAVTGFSAGYSTYAILCFTLALDVLRHPEPSDRLTGRLARQRAHPWLVATSIALLTVSMIMVGIMVWVLQDAQHRSFMEIYLDSIETIAWLDWLVSSVIGIATIMLGQAMVSYEVFTGKSLPRRGLLRHWQRLNVLAVSYGVVIGAIFAFNLRPIYGLLLPTILMTLFYALVSWRSYVERDNFMASLRPFISSQGLYEQLLTTSTPPEVDIHSPFHVLCRDVLATKVAYLVAVGPLSALVGPPIVHPINNKTALPPLNGLLSQFATPDDFPMIEAEKYGGATWAISLWSERGLIGVLLLGDKTDGGLYTQEEMQTARAIGERLIDAQASREMSQRLMLLQRERLAQTQVIDQQTRRVLHDDILPTLQTALITLSSAAAQNGAVASAIDTMTDAHRQISNLLRDMPTTSAPDVARSGLLPALRRTVETDLSHAFDDVVWQVQPEAAERSHLVPSLTAEVLFYGAREAIRNAAKYGRGDGTLGNKRPFVLTISLDWRNGLFLQIEDNGVGIMPNRQSQGTGHGLALHSTMMAVVGGEITINSVPNQFTAVALTLPADRIPTPLADGAD